MTLCFHSSSHVYTHADFPGCPESSSAITFSDLTKLQLCSCRSVWAVENTPAGSRGRDLSYWPQEARGNLSGPQWPLYNRLKPPPAHAIFEVCVFLIVVGHCLLCMATAVLEPEQLWSLTRDPHKIELTNFPRRREKWVMRGPGGSQRTWGHTTDGHRPGDGPLCGVAVNEMLTPL